MRFCRLDTTPLVRGSSFDKSSVHPSECKRQPKARAWARRPLCIISPELERFQHNQQHVSRETHFLAVLDWTRTPGRRTTMAPGTRRQRWIAINSCKRLDRPPAPILMTGIFLVINDSHMPKIMYQIRKVRGLTLDKAFQEICLCSSGC